jgi:FHS family Na+ dependent glucose MFS transporter 1
MNKQLLLEFAPMSHNTSPMGGISLVYSPIMHIPQSTKSGMINSPIAITAIYYAAFVGLGMVAAALGPTLPGLAEQTGVQLKQASWLFSATSLGYLLGALAAGRLYDRRLGHPVMALALVLAAALMALVPTMPQLVLLALVMLLLGGAQAGVDVGGNTLLVWLHRHKVAPFMNGLHLFWGVGSILAPILIVQAILYSGSYAWGYWLIALLLLPVAVLVWRAASPHALHHEPGAAPQQPVNWPLVVLFMLFFLTFVGAEGAYGGWIYSYAVATGIAAPAVAAYLTSAYWGALTLSRLVSIPLSVRFRPRTLLIVDLAGCLIALGLAVLGSGSPLLIWLATLMFGASVATLFPLTMSFAGEVLTVTGQFTSLMFVGASLGGMLIPWLIGQFFESAGPGSAMWIMLVDMMVCAGVFGLLNWVKKRG